MNSKLYDYIIYPASLLGIAFAKYATNAGKSVLLLNRYGFPGSDITYGLNCLQKIPNSETEFCSELFRNISKAGNGLFFADDSYLVINPEVIKYELIKSIEQLKLNRLFHILPLEVNPSQHYISLKTAQKEGEYIFKCRTVVDASENYELVQLLNKDLVSFKRFSLNIFTSSSETQIEIPNNGLIHDIVLKDHRRWMSFELDKPNESKIESSLQEALSKIASALINNGSRLQIVPVQHVEQCETENNIQSDNFISLRQKFKLNGGLADRLTDASILEDK